MGEMCMVLGEKCCCFVCFSIAMGKLQDIVSMKPLLATVQWRHQMRTKWRRVFLTSQGLHQASVHKLVHLYSRTWLTDSSSFFFASIIHHFGCSHHSNFCHQKWGFFITSCLPAVWLESWLLQSEISITKSFPKTIYA